MLWRVTDVSNHIFDEPREMRRREDVPSYTDDFHKGENFPAASKFAGKPFQQCSGLRNAPSRTPPPSWDFEKEKAERLAF